MANDTMNQADPRRPGHLRRARERVLAVASGVERPVIAYRSLVLGSRCTAPDRLCAAVPIDKFAGRQ